MRNVRDYYYKKAKKDNYPARSIYKLEEVQHKYRLLRRGDSVLDLGCYPGSWSLYASQVVGPGGIVVGVDLQEVNRAERPGGAPIHWLRSDITEPGLIRTLREIRPGYTVIISDIAPKTTGNKWADHQQSLRLALHTLSLADLLLHEQGNYVGKVFQGEDFPAFVDEVKARFGFVKVIKPHSSRKESREVFVFGREYHRRRTAPDSAVEGMLDRG